MEKSLTFSENNFPILHVLWRTRGRMLNIRPYWLVPEELVLNFVIFRLTNNIFCVIFWQKNNFSQNDIFEMENCLRNSSWKSFCMDSWDLL